MAARKNGRHRGRSTPSGGQFRCEGWPMVQLALAPKWRSQVSGKLRRANQEAWRREPAAGGLARVPDENALAALHGGSTKVAKTAGIERRTHQLGWRCGRCCKAVTHGRHRTGLELGRPHVLGGRQEQAWRRARGIAIFCDPRLASPASIYLYLPTASVETLCTRRGMGCTVS